MGVEVLARIEQARGNPERALALERKALESFHFDLSEAVSFIRSTIIVLADHQPESVARLYGAHAYQCKRIPLAIAATEKPHLAAVGETLRSALGDDAYEQAISEGAQMPPDQLIPLALDILNGVAPHAPSGSDTER